MHAYYLMVKAGASRLCHSAGGTVGKEWLALAPPRGHDHPSIMTFSASRAAIAR